MGVVQALGGIITNTKIYYDCPGCGKRVWAYPGFVGNRCWDCPGTILHGATRTVVGNTPILSDITDNVSNTVLDTVSDNRQYYHCPHCGEEKWAYGSFKGTTCWECGAVVGTLVDAARKTAVDNTVGVAYDTLRGQPKFAQLMKKVTKKLNPRGLNINDKIYRVKVKSVWLLHGSVAAPLSVASATFTNSSVTHWWVSIETYDDDKWYCAMFNGEILDIQVCNSESQVTNVGKSVLTFGTNNKSVTIKHDGYPQNAYMRHVVSFMKKYDGRYNLNNNNCQVFARALYKSLM